MAFDFLRGLRALCGESLLSWWLCEAEKGGLRPTRAALCACEVVRKLTASKAEKDGFALLGRHFVPTRSFASSLLDRCAASKRQKKRQKMKVNQKLVGDNRINKDMSFLSLVLPEKCLPNEPNLKRYSKLVTRQVNQY